MSCNIVDKSAMSIRSAARRLIFTATHKKNRHNKCKSSVNPMKLNVLSRVLLAGMLASCATSHVQQSVEAQAVNVLDNQALELAAPSSRGLTDAAGDDESMTESEPLPMQLAPDTDAAAPTEQAPITEGYGEMMTDDDNFFLEDNMTEKNALPVQLAPDSEFETDNYVEADWDQAAGDDGEQGTRQLRGRRF